MAIWQMISRTASSYSRLSLAPTGKSLRWNTLHRASFPSSKQNACIVSLDFDRSNCNLPHMYLLHPIRRSSTWNWTKAKTNPDDASNDPHVSPDAKAQKEILDSCGVLYQSLMPLNDKLRGPLPKESDRGTSLPFVFLVGNHSSGKSSFINHVLGRDIQTAGVAPTDDCFTVVAPGPVDNDRDGPALIGDPDMGFSNLRQFGPTLIHHTQLKVRSNIAAENFMMVDSPGMIDSPVSIGGMSHTNNNQIMDRGYDFQGVVRWFAERADVVLLFFDPDKPGTTGETLSILLHSLGGMDHKLLIVLNKSDQFKKIHDFARAYGSLCWNLSKVIPRKDLPRIFTMCLPMKTSGMETSSTTADSQSLADLHQTRDDVVAEVMKAPKRRIDNAITNLNDSANLLQMYARIVEEARSQYSKLLWQNRFQEAAGLTLGISLSGLGVYVNLPLQFTGGVASATVVGVGGMVWYNQFKLKESEQKLQSSEELSTIFQRIHSREISEANEFTTSLWQRIKEQVKVSLRSIGLKNVEKVNSKEMHNLDNILEVEIPRLRRLASPTHFGSK